MTRATDVHKSMRAFPVADLEVLTSKGPMLVLAPHPDDESIGCGGIIAEACARQHEVHVVVMTDGTGSHPSSKQYPSARLRELREGETQAAVAALGLSPARLDFLRLRDGKAPHQGAEFKRVVAWLADFMRDRRIGTVCATWMHDPHPDHLATHLMAKAATEATSAPLYSYPVWGWTLGPRSWLPRTTLSGFRIDIARQLPAKRKAIASHQSQVTTLIDDDPTAFQLSSEFLALFDEPFETFVRS
jgi:LmbE family N-acetylglucosaminyl deacetylase